MAVNPRMLRAVLTGAALIASAAAAAALASSRTAAPPPPPAPVPVPDPPQDDPPQDTAPIPAPVPVRRGRRLWRLLRLILALMVIAAGIGGSVFLQAPNWVPWTLVGLTGVSAICLGIALLIGPVARRLAGETTPLTAAERQQMTASERVEAVNAARHTLIQAATGLVVIGGVAFTALGLWYTARTVETTREGQITDRYTKAVEQIGSAKSMEVRLGGLYALKRIAQDSPPDAETIEDVVVAFILEHDLDVAATPAPKGTPLKASAQRRPGSDVSAALRVLGVISKSRGSYPDITSAQFAQADWRGVNLSGAYLRSADLSGANLRSADLVGANLRSADLSGADLFGADLSGAILSGAILRSAYLSGADLSGAYLRGADLFGAYLRGADLREITGMTAAEIKAVAVTDAKTRF